MDVWVLTLKKQKVEHEEGQNKQAKAWVYGCVSDGYAAGWHIIPASHKNTSIGIDPITNASVGQNKQAKTWAALLADRLY